MPRPVTDEDRAEIRRLHGEGRSLNQIAKDLDRAPSTISDHAAAMGLSFDRSRTEAAVRAHAIDAAARRGRIIDRLYKRAEFNLARLEAGAYQYTDRVATGIVTEVLDHVPAVDEKNLISAIGGSLQAAAKLEAVSVETDVAEDRSMLGDLLAKLRGISASA